MRKFMLLAAAMVLSLTAAHSEGKVIEFKSLPQSAQQFIKKHFAAERVSYVKSESRGMWRGYDVKMESGKELEFNSSGEWSEIDCVRAKVPTAIIPSPIMAYVRKHHKGAWVTAIERSGGMSARYEVKLSNGLKVEFDKNFKVKEIDD